MQKSYRLNPVISIIFMLFALRVLAENNTNHDQYQERIIKEITKIKSCHINTLDYAGFNLHYYLQSHPEFMRQLEQNSDSNGNFQYLVARFEKSRYLFNDKLRNDAKIQNWLLMAAQKKHAGALYVLGQFALNKNRPEEALDYFKRSFYAGYYGALGGFHQFTNLDNHQLKQIADMQDYAENLTDADFAQFYQLAAVYLYQFNDLEKAQHYFRLAEQKASNSEIYQLAELYPAIYQQEACSEQALSYYQQSMQAGNALALDNLLQHFFSRCGIYPYESDKTPEQALLREGLQQIETHVNQQGLNLGLLHYIRSLQILGRLYSTNLIVPTQRDKFEYYYQQAIDLGDYRSYGMLGEAWYPLEHTPDYEVNYRCEKALPYFKQGAAHNDLTSLRYLSQIYLKNQCVAMDKAQAIAYQEQLIRLTEGSTDIYHTEQLIDDLYQMGYFALVKKYAQPLAEQNLSHSIQRMAQVSLKSQDGLNPDVKQALFWYQKYFENFPEIYNSTEQGHAYYKAALELSNAGFNTQADNYFREAAERGNEAAKRMLQEPRQSRQ